MDTDLNRCNYTSAIYYIWAKIGNYYLKDVDILPLQGLSWQTNVVSIIKNQVLTTNIACIHLQKLFFSSLWLHTLIIWHGNIEWQKTK